MVPPTPTRPQSRGGEGLLANRPMHLYPVRGGTNHVSRKGSFKNDRRGHPHRLPDDPRHRFPPIRRVSRPAHRATPREATTCWPARDAPPTAPFLPEILSDDAIVADGLAGPFRPVDRRVSLTAVAAAILDADGREVTGPVAPGAQFYIRPRPGGDGVLLTATVPAPSNGSGGRVVTGVARDDSTAG